MPMQSLQDSERLIRLNAEAHDRVVGEYDKRHVEIFNPTEQDRLARVLEAAFGSIEGEGDALRALDFGAGTGNLTRHMLERNAKAIVTATDVSSGCLELVATRFGGTGRVETSQLNGRDLCQFSDDRFDLVATYSVLHHIPDYLAAVRELLRVVKPGGLLLIDHEAAPHRWQPSDEYKRYMADLGGESHRQFCVQEGIPHADPFLQKWQRRARRAFSPSAWRVFIQRRMGSGLSVTQDGDIHVFAHDHIEWDKITELASVRFEILREEDYLVCREWDPAAPVWNRWKDRCSDTRLLLARKRKTATG